MKKHIRDCIAALEEIGIEVLGLDESHKHPRILMRYQGVERFIITSSSPQSASDEANHAVQRARRAFGIKGGKGEQRKPRHKRKAEAPVPMPELSPDPRHDYHEDLTQHPLYPAVLDLRLQAAFAGLWRDTCMDLFGAPSVAEAMKPKPQTMIVMRGQRYGRKQLTERLWDQFPGSKIVVG